MLEYGYLAVLLGLFLPLVFLACPATAKSPRDRVPWYDFLLAGASVLGPAFSFIFALDIIGAKSDWAVSPPLIPFILGITTWLLILEGARRGPGGTALAAIMALLSAYPLFASHLPDLLFAKSYPLSRLAGYYYLGVSSIFGLPMQMFGGILMGFMVFGVVLVATGAAKFFLELAQGLLGRLTGGPALVAVMASAFLASLSGSPVANVIGTGNITIPAMKKLGFRPYVAGAIESVASTGGVLMPPVMGTAAFLMATFLRIPYLAVCKAAAIPMVVYYISLFAQVHLYAKRNKLAVLDTAEIPSIRRTLKEGWFYIGSVIVLMYLLFYVRVETWAPFFASGFLILCTLIRKQTRPNLEKIRSFTMSMGRTFIEITPTIAGVGIIIGALGLTGVGQSISGALVSLAQGNLYIMLIFGAIGGIILGTGMTITACYIFMALIFAPSLISLGVPPIAAHFFFLYWGMLSFITPPVCLSAYMGAAIAGAGILRTALQSVRMGIVGFALPFIFVLNPALIAEGPLLSVVWTTLTAIIGTILLAMALEGYVTRIGDIGWVARLSLFAAGVLLLFTPLVAKAAGGVLALLVAIFSIRAKRRQVV